MVEYSCCQSDQNIFIASGGTWTVDGNRGGCLVTDIHTSLRLPDGTVRDCASYVSSGTGIASFYIMLHNGQCCLRSWKQSNTECTKQSNDIQYCNPSVKKFARGGFCGRKLDKRPCANNSWKNSCEACMCFNYGNRAWCDGYRGDYYDTYFEEHGENPWGDTNPANKKCNEEFLPKEAECERDWQCTLGFHCQTQTPNLSVTNDAYYSTCQHGYPDPNSLNGN